jgi:hypothetical protein
MAEWDRREKCLTEKESPDRRGRSESAEERVAHMPDIAPACDVENAGNGNQREKTRAGDKKPGQAEMDDAADRHACKGLRGNLQHVFEGRGKGGGMEEAFNQSIEHAYVLYQVQTIAVCDRNGLHISC